MSAGRAILGTALLLCATLIGGGRVQAAPGQHHWSDQALRLSLTYPAGWSAVPERGAALKLRAAGGDAEFEIFQIAQLPAPSALAARAGSALSHLHCQVKATSGSRQIGQLGVRGSVATGVCTGTDQGWRLTITAFNYAGHGLLLRSWLYHGRASESADLLAISASLSRAGA